MPRDFKHRAQSKKKRKPVSPWFGLVAGLSIGLFVAFLIFIRMQTPHAPPPFEEEAESQPVETPREATVDVRKDSSDAIPPPPKTRFEFYDTLPEMQIVIPEIEAIIPEQEIKGKSEAGVKQVEQPGTYYLQAGSFRSPEQADRFKAELVLQGFKTSIQKVTINNTDTFHRVRVGPFQDLDALNQARQLLNKQGIENKLIKITG
jgi:cell division protein FtsN